ncbi:MAG: OmpA family protein [Saprospiraceae bacterium]|nr:OmpA family protein [Saprospiraceae bacterium]
MKSQPGCNRNPLWLIRNLTIGTFILFLLIPAAGYTQPAKWQQVDAYVASGQYRDALDILHYLEGDPYQLALKQGICYYGLNKLQTSLDFFTQAYNLTKTPDPDLFYWLGMTYHQQLRFEPAVQQFKAFLRLAKSGDQRLQTVKDLIRICGNGVRIQYQDQLGYLEVFPAQVNTIYDEIAPRFSPNYADRIYFSGQRFPETGKGFDMLSSEISDGSWSNPFEFNPSLNTPADEVLYGFANQGQEAIYLQRLSNESRILVDTFNQQEKSQRGIWHSPLDLVQGDDYLYIYHDSLILFASKRPGGYGGYDLYASRMVDQRWSRPFNLGPVINSAADEITPFLTNDGHQLYFSSNRPDLSIGGYDVFFSTLESVWSVPRNMGIPVNSAGNDVQFCVGPEGKTGVFASDRKESLGGTDLYFFYFKDVVTAQLAMIHDQVSWFKQLMPSDSMVSGNGKMTVTLEIPFLAYGSDDVVMTPVNQKHLQDLLLLLRQHPAWTIDIITHSDNQQTQEYNPFFSIKRSEKIRDYFTQAGVSDRRIFLEGCGATYPVALNEINLLPNPSGQRLNRRIEFRLHAAPEEVVRFIYLQPEVVDHFKDSTYQEFENFTKGLYYKVLVQQSTRPFYDQRLDQFTGFTIEKMPDQTMYDYTVLGADTYFKANQLKREIRALGFVDATVLAYVDGRRVTPEDIRKYVNNYPDLIYYQYRSE